jgi:hypothetical protein
LVSPQLMATVNSSKLKIFFTVRIFMGSIK